MINQAKMNNYNKILIIGCPGTGKSTLARKLGNITKLPIIHLDKFWHDKSLWSGDITQKKKQWRRYVTKLVEDDRWVMDGNYTSTLDIRIPNSDLIIFLDYSVFSALFGVMKRRLQFWDTSKVREDMPIGWEEKINHHLIKKVLEFKRSHKPRILKYIEDNSSNALIFRKRKELLGYINQLKKIDS